jgi:hypothetical protein
MEDRKEEDSSQSVSQQVSDLTDGGQEEEVSSL